MASQARHLKQENIVKKLDRKQIRGKLKINKRQKSQFSPWDWGQIGIKLVTKHVIHQKLANIM